MSAYASAQREFATCASRPFEMLQLVATPPSRSPNPTADSCPADGGRIGAAFVAQLADQLADRVAALVTERLAQGNGGQDDWYDSRHAAEYLGVHRDTLRKLAAERTIPTEQDGPGCKLYFRRSDLDAWRRSGRRPRHLASVA